MDTDKWRFRILPTAIILFSSLLIGFGARRFFAEFELIPGNFIYENITEGVGVEEKDLKTLEKSRTSSLEYYALPRTYTDLGTVYLLFSQREHKEAEKRHYVNLAVSALERGLVLDPINGYAWLRLSSAYILLNGEHSDKAVQAWRMSVKVADFDPRILLPRIYVGIQLYNALSREDVQVLKRQLKYAYKVDRNKFLVYARKHSFVDWIKFLSPQEGEMHRFFSQ